MGHPISRQTIATYISRLERHNLINRHNKNYIYYFANWEEYQWYFSKDGGATWEKSSATTKTLAPILRSYRDGNLYRCAVTSGRKLTVYTDAAARKSRRCLYTCGGGLLLLQ